MAATNESRNRASSASPGAAGIDEAGAQNVYFDPHFNIQAAKILPGEFYATQRDMMIVTVLGSCVSACIRDRETGIGGGNVMQRFTVNQVGTLNAEFALSYLKTEQISVVSQDLLDIHPRKVYYFPQTGRVLVKKLRTLNNATITVREQQYQQRIGVEEMSGDMELFT